jgi:hypothetical protein
LRCWIRATVEAAPGGAQVDRQRLAVPPGSSGGRPPWARMRVRARRRHDALSHADGGDRPGACLGSAAPARPQADAGTARRPYPVRGAARPRRGAENKTREGVVTASGSLLVRIVDGTRCAPTAGMTWSEGVWRASSAKAVRPGSCPCPPSSSRRSPGWTAGRSPHQPDLASNVSPRLRGQPGSAHFLGGAWTTRTPFGTA